jgi:hypothetical protein
MPEIVGTDIVRGAYRLMNRPPQADIRYKDIVANARDVVLGRLLDLKMSNRNHTSIVGAWRTPTAQTENATLYASSEMFIPTKAEWRYVNGDAAQVPHEVEFCSLESISENSQLDREYVALYDNNTKVQWSAPLTVLSTREYRIVYEDLEIDDFSQLASVIENFPSQFLTLCQYETAAITIHQVDNDTEAWMMKKERLLQTIKPMLETWIARFETWRLSRFGNRKVYKKGFRPRARRVRV